MLQIITKIIEFKILKIMKSKKNKKKLIYQTIKKINFN